MIKRADNTKCAKCFNEVEIARDAQGVVTEVKCPKCDVIYPYPPSESPYYWRTTEGRTLSSEEK